jgi:hypothetical protein
VATYLALISLCQKLAPDAFAFRDTPYEFETARPAFDLLVGSDKTRRAILDGTAPEDVVALVSPVDPSLKDAVFSAESRLARCAIS